MFFCGFGYLHLCLLQKEWLWQGGRREKPIWWAEIGGHGGRRLEDFRQAAEILKGRGLTPGGMAARYKEEIPSKAFERQASEDWRVRPDQEKAFWVFHSLCLPL